MGFLNGMFSGIAYTAPMLACHLYFPDRKQFIGTFLLLGLAIGVATYSGLTAHWAASCEPECADLSHVLRLLAYCMFGHTTLASLLLSTPRKQLNTEEMRQLHYNLLNV